MITVKNNREALITLRSREVGLIHIRPNKSVDLENRVYEEVLPQITTLNLIVKDYEEKHEDIIVDSPEEIKPELDPIESSMESSTSDLDTSDSNNSDVDYSSLSRNELKKLCEDRELSTSGYKSTLVERLVTKDNEGE